MSKNILKLLLAVGSFAIYYVFINPLYTGIGGVWQPTQSVKSLRDLNTQYTETLNQADVLYTQAQSLSSQYNSVSDDTKQKTKLMVPDSVDPIRLLNEVSNIAGQTGVALSDLNYISNPLVMGNYGIYSVSFSVTTTYSKFKELMHNYETSLRLFTIKNVTFNVSAKDSSLIDFQVKLETYYMK
ncbi:MAG: type 4a pilus biogenesis protein PilO [Candidatus Paceibacterota bacterium]|jgi:hypothetical protein